MALYKYVYDYDYDKAIRNIAARQTVAVTVQYHARQTYKAIRNVTARQTVAVTVQHQA